jgi:2,3-dihydroxybiphenyl 1,2-dioxygenase
MNFPIKLGYLHFAVKRPQRWQEFLANVLGLPAGIENSDGSRGYRVDDRVQRLILSEGEADDLASLGLELPDARSLEDLAIHLRSRGIAVRRGAAGPLNSARRVEQLIEFEDPAGTRLEAYCGPQKAADAFASSIIKGGFETGDLGLGHAVMVSHDLEAMENFYCGVLGFGVTERLATRVGPIDVRGIFLHCNRRHHSIALFDLPIKKRMHHFMLQANQLKDVGHAYEAAQRNKVKFSLGLGQHPDPDGTFSFYGVTPSGFDFEVGAGTNAIEPGDWNTMHTQETSSWGHKPTLGLQLRMARGLIASRLGL